MATSTQEWIDELKSISVLELAERIKALEEEFGVSAQAVAAAAPAAGGAAADRAGDLEADFAPGAGMVCASLRPRGAELLGQRKGLNSYAESGSTMGVPLLYPWANRIAARRFEVLGRTVDLDRAPHRFRDDGET